MFAVFALPEFSEVLGQTFNLFFITYSTLPLLLPAIVPNCIHEQQIETKNIVQEEEDSGIESHPRAE